jgi:Reverse transcriptase (RNA-dependent DNA polymerase)
MASMLKICPRGEEKTALFACLFLKRLPREIRILLAKADHKDPKALAEEADKKDNTWWSCGDYRHFNNITVPDKYPVPNIQDMSAKLTGCSVFTKLDLKKGYYQILVVVADVPKMAVTTPFGMFEFLRMPFGLKNAGQSFQRRMDTVTADLAAAMAILDDVIIASSPVSAWSGAARRSRSGNQRFQAAVGQEAATSVHLPVVLPVVLAWRS